MIPKVIHYCWFGSGAKSDLIKRCMASWATVMPDYEIREWNESNSPMDHAYCRAAREQKLWSKLSNFVRLRVLQAEGGLYLDTDVEVIRSFDGLRSLQCYLGFQRIPEVPGWVNTAVLGSEAGHSYIQRCLDETLDHFQRTGAFELSPRIATSVLKAAGLKSYGRQKLAGVDLFPVDYFYPYSWLETFRPECITSNTLAVHHWCHSWKES